MNHSVEVLISEKYGKHLYAGNKKHMTINSSSIEQKALPNHKPCKKLRGKTPSITRSIPVALFSSRFFLHIVHVINFTSHHGNLSFFSFWSHTEQKPRKIRSSWLNERQSIVSQCNQLLFYTDCSNLVRQGQASNLKQAHQKKGCYKWINL